MASASAVMVGHKIGEGNEEDGANYAWRFSALAWLGGLLIGGLMAATSPSILSQPADSMAGVIYFVLISASVIFFLFTKALLSNLLNFTI
jgi:Na+-driven multidrug efflux pump